MRESGKDLPLDLEGVSAAVRAITNATVRFLLEATHDRLGFPFGLRKSSRRWSDRDVDARPQIN